LNSSIARYKKELLKTWEELPTFFTCSAVTRTGRDEILSFIEEVNQKSEVFA
jgi:GTP-binding protein